MANLFTNHLVFFYDESVSFGDYGENINSMDLHQALYEI